MKRSILFLLTIAIMILFIGCGLIGNDPMHAELRLVPLTTGDLSKAITDYNGNRYLPAEEMANILQKKASADIDFGEMEATRTLQYVLMNVGNTDVYDITFVANDLTIHPTKIPLVPTPGEGGDLVALPIVSISKEHVMPLSGVGSLMELDPEVFSDVMTLCYNYDLSHSQSDSTYIGDSLVVTDTVIVDSFDIADEYTVAGIKQGALIDILASGRNVVDAVWHPMEYYDLALVGTVLTIDLYESDLDTLVVLNNGNVPLRMRVVNPNVYYSGSGEAVIDTVIIPGAEVDVSGLVRDPYFFDDTHDATKGNIMILGSETNQPYIFKAADEICIDGEFRIAFSELVGY